MPRFMTSTSHLRRAAEIMRHGLRSATHPDLRLTMAALAAIAVTASTVPSFAASDDWEKEWQETLAAAKREGKVVVMSPAPGVAPRNAISQFSKVYPEIAVQIRPYVANREQQILAERKAGKYLLDIKLGGQTALPGAAQELRDSGGYLPVRDSFILPEVRDEKSWLFGWNGRFLDKDQKYVFAFQAEINYQVYVNRDRVPQSSLSRIEQLIEPEWKGKFTMLDPTKGFLFSTIGHLHISSGEDFVRKLLMNDPQVISVPRQQVEWLVRGRRPIAISIQPLILVDFQKGGLGKNIEALAPETKAGGRLSAGYGTLMLMSKAPHPNASKVFVNWLLSKEGSTAWSKVVEKYMARVDVPGPARATTSGRVDPNKTYLPEINNERNAPIQARVRKLYREIIQKKR